MSCDPASGKLKILHFVSEGDEEIEGLTFPIDALFSHDGGFAYVLDGNSGGIAIFKVEKDKLHWQEFYRGEDSCLAGSRGATLSPDGKVMYVASSRANALAVLDLNSETGRLKVKQVLWDEEDEIEGLAGVFGVVTTRNGEFIYTTSGRFNGDSAVSAFRRDKDGKLTLVHELIAERDELPLFLGGNRLVLSPDEKNIYAVGSRSGAVASFERDSTSGKIKVLETFTHDDVNGITAGAAGVAVSPDGKYVYIAAEGEATISIYTRRGATDEKKTEPEK
jgi:6-phosphogluconolactonase (cycloisomerase 2 family)